MASHYLRSKINQWRKTASARKALPDGRIRISCTDKGDVEVVFDRAVRRVRFPRSPFRRRGRDERRGDADPCSREREARQDQETRDGPDGVHVHEVRVREVRTEAPPRRETPERLTETSKGMLSSLVGSSKRESPEHHTEAETSLDNDSRLTWDSFGPFC